MITGVLIALALSAHVAESRCRSGDMGQRIAWRLANRAAILLLVVRILSRGEL